MGVYLRGLAEQPQHFCAYDDLSQIAFKQACSSVAEWSERQPPFPHTCSASYIRPLESRNQQQIHRRVTQPRLSQSRSLSNTSSSPLCPFPMLDALQITSHASLQSIKGRTPTRNLEKAVRALSASALRGQLAKRASSASVCFMAHGRPREHHLLRMFSVDNRPSIISISSFCFLAPGRPR